ncbi:MAG TPA: class II fumarate hydratase [Steroidobacteraceae bacterium]|nr:class II fumarate hydratase [Steroidobacteraceae bacterium]
MPEKDLRVEHDSMGAVAIPAGAPWGAQTQRALDIVRLSERVLPPAFIRALALVKWAAARANAALGALDPPRAAAIERAALAIAEGAHSTAFPLDVFQTGSGTSTNMNVNEVVAQLATQDLGAPVHPNDDVNRSQSSNDCIPTAIHVSAALRTHAGLLPALRHLSATLGGRIPALEAIVKTGRTHLMDAVPLTVGQEWSGWQAQVNDAVARLEATLPRLLRLAQGGTAIGTGLNAPPGFGARVAAELATRTGLAFIPNPSCFAAIACQDTAVELSGQTRVAAITLLKIATDLRLMNSGPLAGLGEISLPALQAGSSIMPGKVNPVVPEAVAMAAAQVVGNDATIAMAAQFGVFQLNTGLPVIASNLLESLGLIANAARALADRALAGLTVNEPRLAAALARNPILVTALNPLIGYEAGARIAKEAYATGEPVLEVAVRLTGLPRAQLVELLDPRRLTRNPNPG